MIQELIESHQLQIKVVEPRKSKYGDFKYRKNGTMEITVNNDLNKHQFLLTLIHEIAHQLTHLKYGKVKPHGKEWKTTFKKLMNPA